MIDTHTHVYAEQFDSDRDVSILRAKEMGISAFIMPNVDKESFPRMMDVYHQNKTYCFPSFGLHPTSVKENYQEELDWIYQQAQLHNGIFKAVGEIGIDCYWSLDHIQQQRDAFQQQLLWAQELNLPVIIHAREAFHEIYPILDQLHTDKLRGVFHSFSGTLDDYSKIKGYKNFKVGIGGVVTFKNAKLAEVVAEMNPKDIVLETDAPYLAPHPHRGKRNESAYLPLIAEKIASLKQMSVKELMEITSRNAEQLFLI